MGGPETAALLLSAVGTGASIAAQREAENERRSILNRQLENEDAASKKSAEKVLQAGEQFTQQNRQDALAGAEDQIVKQSQADLQGAGGATIATAADAGNASDDFLKTKAARAIEEGTRLTALAREQAKARAPGQLRMDDSLNMARLAGDLGNLWGTTKNLAGANTLDAQSVTEPGYGGLGKVATAVGGAMGASGYGRAKPTYATGIGQGLASMGSGISWGG